jgi:hypothetical protein
MDIDQASVFLAGSILIMIGLVVIVVGIVAINNIVHKHWKSFGWKVFPDVGRFTEPTEINKTSEPSLEKKNEQRV